MARLILDLPVDSGLGYRVGSRFEDSLESLEHSLLESVRSMDEIPVVLVFEEESGLDFTPRSAGEQPAVTRVGSIDRRAGRR